MLNCERVESMSREYCGLPPWENFGCHRPGLSHFDLRVLVDFMGSPWFPIFWQYLSSKTLHITALTIALLKHKAVMIHGLILRHFVPNKNWCLVGLWGEWADPLSNHSSSLGGAEAWPIQGGKLNLNWNFEDHWIAISSPYEYVVTIIVSIRGYVSFHHMMHLLSLWDVNLLVFHGVPTVGTISRYGLDTSSVTRVYPIQKSVNLVYVFKRDQNCNPHSLGSFATWARVVWWEQ